MLHLFDRINDGRGQDGGPSLFGLAHDAVNLGGRDEGPYAVVNCYYVNARPQRPQAAPDRFGSRRAARDDGGRSLQAVSAHKRERLFNRNGGRDHERFRYRLATLEPSERMDNDWDAGDFPELLCPPRACALAPARGDDDRDVHTEDDKPAEPASPVKDNSRPGA